MFPNGQSLVGAHSSNRDVSEQVADALAIMRATDGLGNGAADVDDPKLRTAFELVAQRHRVGYYHLRQAALVDRVDRRSLFDYRLARAEGFFRDFIAGLLGKRWFRET